MGVAFAVDERNGEDGGVDEVGEFPNHDNEAPLEALDDALAAYIREGVKLSHHDLQGIYINRESSRRFSDISLRSLQRDTPQQAVATTADPLLDGRRKNHRATALEDLLGVERCTVASSRRRTCTIEPGEEGNSAPATADDVLKTGELYLGVSMMVYMYAHLREMCVTGHTYVSMLDIECNSATQSMFSLDGDPPRYLDNALTFDSIISTVMDEYDRAEKDRDCKINEICGNEIKQYERE